MVWPRKSKPSSMCTTRVLSGGQPQPQRGYHLRDLVQQRLRVMAAAFDHDDEVVGVPDQPVGGLTALAAPVSLITVTHRRPRPSEVLVQDGQGDVGQQR
jgi:hypothetical protein